MVSPHFKVQEETREGNYAKFVVEPLEPGFGQTLGVALRRVLLANMQGSAITTVSITGVTHMFAAVPGLREDVVDFLLNIKGIQVKLAEGKSDARISLKKVGPGDITAADIEVTDGVEIVNPDHYLGSLADKKAKVEMEMTVEKGMGYSLAEERRVSTVGVIPIDAIFSPVVKVAYKVEQTRVGRQTNFDKLLLEVWTSGTIDPQVALMEAGRILVSYFSQMYEPKADMELGTTGGDDIMLTPAVSEDLLRMTVDELDLPTRIYNSLRNAGIETVGQLLGTPKKELMAYRNLGAKSLSIIEESLKEKGIPFNA
jgi:DNA-directed RNA polymerase subunit alpha